MLAIFACETIDLPTHIQLTTPCDGGCHCEAQKKPDIVHDVDIPHWTPVGLLLGFGVTSCSVLWTVV